MEYNFLESDNSIEDNDIIIVGYPYDSSASFRAGSRKGPMSLRYYSYSLETFSPYFKKDIHTKKYADIGDIELSFGDFNLIENTIYNKTKELLQKGKRIISIGGEHTITYPIIKAYNENYENLIMIILDAHADLREEYLGNKYSHACTSNLCSKVIGYNNIIQLGPRSYTEEEYKLLNNLLFYSENINDFDFSLLKDKNIYLSIDLDILDPSILPGTGTPEPDGIMFNDLIKFLTQLYKFKVIGADIMELAPDYDISGISSIVASKILRELILILS